MESLMWVLIYLCMTVDGPGGKSRDALKTDADLKDSLTKYFFGVLLQSYKAQLFTESTKDSRTYLDRDLLKHFHPSFEGVKKLIYRWLSTLRMCYKFPERASSIHELFLKQIDKVIKNHEEPSDAVYRKYSEDEKRRRKKHIKNIEVFRQDKTGDPFIFDLGGHCYEKECSRSAG